MSVDFRVGIYFLTNMTAEEAIATAKKRVWIQGDRHSDTVWVRFLRFTPAGAPGARVEGLLRMDTESFYGEDFADAVAQRDYYRLYWGLFFMGGLKLLQAHFPVEQADNLGWELTVRQIAASREGVTL